MKITPAFLIILIIILIFIYFKKCNCSSEGFSSREEKVEKAKEIKSTIGGGNFPKFKTFQNKMERIQAPTDIVTYSDIKKINNKNGMDPEKIADVL